MTSDQGMQLISALLMLVLVISSLAARRLSFGQTLKFALAWVTIFAAGLVLYAFRGVFEQGWERVTAEIFPEKPIQSGQAIRILMSDDGHFHVRADVNGHPVNFLIDSGATTTALSSADARAAGVEVDRSGFPVAVDTANGISTMWRARVQTLRVGALVREDVHVLVPAEANEDVNLLGMNFLSSLGHWRVDGREMVLQP